ncbi:unnamed protein product [Echinostoma caproni]|uniref:IST1 homolog n=1 Tax=Echinostoma caproni TaxID=27848 RepID=A0A183B8N4_9TREM|nr:unnamed protein product [Echinostoma caproni]
MSMGAIDFEKLKCLLNVTLSRFDVLIRKHTERSLVSRGTVCDYLRQDKVERARIHAEQMIRDDSYVEALEVVKTLHTVLISRMGLLKNGGPLDQLVREAISTILWASTVLSVEIPEYKSIVQIFGKMFDKSYVSERQDGSSDEINVTVKQKLNLIPGHNMIEVYLVSPLAYHGDLIICHTLDTSVVLHDISYLVALNLSVNGEGSSNPPALPISLRNNLTLIQNHSSLACSTHSHWKHALIIIAKIRRLNRNMDSVHQFLHCSSPPVFFVRSTILPLIRHHPPSSPQLYFLLPKVGICVFIHQSVASSWVPNLDFSTREFQLMWLKLRLPSFNHYLYVLYRSPHELQLIHI